MTKADVDEVAYIERECFSLPWSKEALIESLELPHSMFIVAKIGGEIVGYGGVYITYDEAEVTNIAVKSEYRKQGIGRMLVDGVVSQAQERGANTIVLEVRESNLPAISLYEKCGFENIGIRKDFYERPVENAVIMWKRG